MSNLTMSFDNRWSVVEYPFKLVGLYDVSPITRGSIVAISTGLALWYFKPSALFLANGDPKEFESKPSSPKTVMTPWYSIAGLAGATSALLI